ncbi:Restriction endonuclease subunit R [Petrocella atlantisensis]|uniref:Restriction endonuclease subunit R n=1 Tax=Petrocella atlantisensis TaxID=2173034 RepID=A0A3P7PEE4_9FIRM|nr:DEAD/DEAH box helicase family protein [Petrocella atlantisensis]VDN47268.1 Restriction endonuclease subunit R [Petrocella atlantisensis]
MSKRIEFQFDDDLEYQSNAIKAVVDLFKGLPRLDDGIYRPKHIRNVAAGDPVRNISIVTGSKLLKNVRQVQLKNKLFADNDIYNNNFTVEMETGTGKTYVYLRTILELYKEYNFKKFMIVVPSIAIRKGIEKSIEQLKDHYKRLYDVDLQKHSFVYDSNNPKMVSTNLVETNDLSICVLNIQAFNKDTNKIRKEDEYGQILWEDIKYIKPIVIIDEPQKIEGQKGKKSKSLKALDDLDPLFTLRYSATHKELYNQIYKLDSYAAYKGELVKKIQVKTVNGIIEKDVPYIRYLKFTSDLKARIEIFSQDQGGVIRIKQFNVGGSSSLEELSGGLVQYRNMRIAEEPHKLRPLSISTPSGTITIELGKSNNGIEDSEAIRIQIRLAIKNHFEKQLSILKSGKHIKTITLFFVDAVKKVRDNEREDRRGEYLRIFDDEYAKAILKYEKAIERYKEYFPAYKDIQSIREGYFALDKKKNEVEIDDWEAKKDEYEVKAKSQEDIDRGISLILEKKDELISFEEPLGFIFSHSALREGWDNPNVFTLCTLKQGSSEIAKKQEIGRGLRLPVDITGNRCFDTEINELTVIANDSYDNFSRSLQDDFNESMNFNKNEVTADIITTTFQSAGVPKLKITPELVDTFKTELQKKGILDKNNVLNKNIEQTTKLLETIQFEDETLLEHAMLLKKEFIKLMLQKGSNRIEIKNGDNEPYTNGIRAFVSEEEFEKLYYGLCDKLTKRTHYKCNIDKDVFIDACAEEINQYLKHFKINKSVNIVTSKAGFNEAQKFELLKEEEGIYEVEAGENTSEKSDFEIANYIMYHTMLPRLAIIKILKKIEKREALSFQDMLDTVTQKILEKLKDMKAANITSYEVIDGYELDAGQIFATDTINEEDFRDEWRVFKADPSRKKAMNEYYKMDSEGEKIFAGKLESNENVIMFTKLKKGGFVIDTPYGHYSPDWAVVCRKEGPESGSVGIYFIVETKAGKQEKDLTSVERNKIKCGELHFKAVSELVTFDWVNSYEDFKTKFGVKETI